MTISEMEELFDGRNPIKCSDGSFALIIRFSSDNGEIGIQSPGADEYQAGERIEHQALRWRKF